MEMGWHSHSGGDTQQRPSQDVRLFSRSGDDITPAFPDLIEALPEDAVIDGELVVARDAQVATFSDLQQRLNRKVVSAAMLRDHPVALMAYDLLQIAGEDLRALPLPARRARLEALVRRKRIRASCSRPLCPSRPGRNSRRNARSRLKIRPSRA